MNCPINVAPARINIAVIITCPRYNRGLFTLIYCNKPYLVYTSLKIGCICNKYMISDDEQIQDNNLGKDLRSPSFFVMKNPNKEIASNTTIGEQYWYRTNSFPLRAVYFGESRLIDIPDAVKARTRAIQIGKKHEEYFSNCSLYCFI